MVKPNTFIHIEAFMINDLNLKGNELLVYAIIYGFSQDGKSHFTGSLQYLADWTNSTKRGVIKVLQKLQQRKVIEKRTFYKNGMKYCEYKACEKSGEQSSLGYGTKFTGGSEQSSHNTIDNTISDTIDRQTCAEAQSFEKPTPKEVFDFYHENKLAIKPDRFWNYNNKKKWKVKDWKSAYLGMCERFTLDEEYDESLTFNQSDYDYYSGE